MSTMTQDLYNSADDVPHDLAMDVARSIAWAENSTKDDDMRLDKEAFVETFIQDKTHWARIARRTVMRLQSKGYRLEKFAG